MLVTTFDIDKNPSNIPCLVLEPFHESTIHRRHIQPPSLIEIDDRKNLRLKNLEFVRMFQIPNPLVCPYDVSEDM
jgi:hypothetical protein